MLLPNPPFFMLLPLPLSVRLTGGNANSCTIFPSPSNVGKWCFLFDSSGRFLTEAVPFFALLHCIHCRAMS